MDIISPQAHRALNYLVTLATGGAAPTLREFDEYAGAPEIEPAPRGADHLREVDAGAQRSAAGPQAIGDNGTSRLARFSRSATTGYAEQFLRLGWARTVRGGDHLSPTPLAYALLRGLTVAPLEPSAVAVTRTLDDPIAYGMLLQRMPGSHDLLVVDPHLTLEQFQHLVTAPSVTRVLITPQEAQLAAAFEEILRGWSAAPEVRVASGMHDRYVVPRRGEAFMVGAATATGSVTLVNLGGFSEDVRVRCERWWDHAKPLQRDEAREQPKSGPALAPATAQPNVVEMQPKG